MKREPYGKYIFIKKDSRGTNKLEIAVVDKVAGLNEGSLQKLLK